MKHAATRMLFSYWDSLRGERAAPERGEVEPGEIRHILADTFILEVDDTDTRFRLAGTRICSLFGRELKNVAFSSLWDPTTPEDAARQIDIVTDETAGVVSGMTGLTSRGDTLEMELLLLPLRHRGRTRARVVGTLSPALIPHWIGFDKLEHIRLGSMRVIWPVGRTETQQFASDDDPVERRRRFVVHQGGRM